MRNRLTSGLLPRLAVTAALLGVLPSLVGAWDEDRVQSQIQPYIGAWGGLYMVDRQDLNTLIPGTPNDFFASALPAAGLSLGVAYSRLHLGINGGYQLIDGDYGPTNKTTLLKNGTPITWYTRNYYYRYQVIPLDINLDVALLPNRYPVNLLIGGSVGIGLVGMQLPIMTTWYQLDSLHTVYRSHTNDWNYSNFLLATGFVGARINLARRLNLEGQIGYRILRSDEIELGKGVPLQRTYETTLVDSTSLVSDTKTTQIPVSLSSVYLRADIRWTFASEAEKDVDRSAARSKEMSERLAMMPRGRISD
jgi:hypothetical protein